MRCCAQGGGKLFRLPSRSALFTALTALSAPQLSAASPPPTHTALTDVVAHVVRGCTQPVS